MTRRPPNPPTRPPGQLPGRPPSGERTEPAFEPDGEQMPRIAREPRSAGQTTSQRTGQRTDGRQRGAARALPRTTDADDGWSWPALIAITLASLGGLAVAAAAAFVVFLPVDLVRDRLVQEVRDRSGRELAIAGSPRISLWPRLGVAMSGVSLSNPPGMPGDPVLTMDALEADVQLWPLLSQQVAIDRLVLHRPVIELRVDGQGRRNWDFADLLPANGAPSRLTRYAQAPAGKDSLPAELKEFLKGASPGAVGGRGAGRKAAAHLDNLSLGDIRVVQGRVRYVDERNGQVEEASGLDLALSAESLAAPLEATASLVWRGEALALKARVTPLRSALEERPAETALTISGRPLQAAFDGSVTFARDIEADGKLTLKIASLAAAARWSGRQLAAAPQPGAIDLTGRVKLAGQTVALADARFDLDGMTATGSLAVDTKGARPHIKGALRFTALDLNRIAAIKAGEPLPAASPPPAAAIAPVDAVSPRSIDDLLKPSLAGPRPQVKGDTRRHGWSTNPIDAAAMGLADADLKIAFDTLAAGTVRTGAGRFAVALKDRAGVVTIEDIQLYSGRASGHVILDATGAGIGIRANLAGDGIDMLALTRDAGGPDWLAGRGRLALALAAAGLSELQLVETLAGKAEIRMADGAIIGINAAQMLRGLQQGRFGGFERSPAEKTDFSELAATFTIANGIADNSDLRLVSPLLRVGGSGTVNLAQRTIDYTLKPRLAGAAQGQPAGGGLNLAGLDVPVRITGSLDKPAIAPDLSGILKDPNQALDALKKLDRKEAEATIKGVIAGDPEAKQKARDFLNQLLKR